ncbi:trihelix transcription factor ASIL2 [Momordica charantia]|uniref:Trihelix transcription factor ASIL2 n=1 Tax=Momordica charantia TaxID=3673 RepID=A0A6J1D6B0_MOMCH|nr:trihelix transcription factor ASIL2 [Momordica charantia]
MDDNGEERYPVSKRYSGNHRESYGSLPRPKIPRQDASYSRPVSNQYVDDDVEDDDEEDEALGEEEDENDQNNGFTHTSEEVDDGDDEDEFDMDEDNKQNNTVKLDDPELERHPKKRRLKNLVSGYELAPRMPAPSSATPSGQKSYVGGRNSLTDWNEHETVVLLDAWGERFLQRGRKSLRSEEWQEVAEKVSEVSKIDRTDTQCRNRLDTLKKKYKKEKSKSTEMGGSSSKWVYFKKMDMLMASPPHQGGLSCGLDSGEYVFMNPRAYLNRANGFDEMRDSPENSESDDGEEDELDGLPPKKRMCGRNSEDDGSSFRLLADSIHKFSEIYEKIESSKRQQMMELEKMRMDFLRDLELQKRQIMERAQAEIAKLRQGDDEEYGASAKSASG